MSAIAMHCDPLFLKTSDRSGIMKKIIPVNKAIEFIIIFSLIRAIVARNQINNDQIV